MKYQVFNATITAVIISVSLCANATDIARSTTDVVAASNAPEQIFLQDRNELFGNDEA